MYHRSPIFFFKMRTLERKSTTWTLAIAIAVTTLLILLGIPSHANQQSFQSLNEKNATFDKVYDDDVITSVSNAYTFYLPRTEGKLNTTILRLKIQTSPDNATVKYPIYATVIQPKVLSSSLEVPFQFRKGQEHITTKDATDKGPYYHAERTLCILEDDDYEMEENSTLKISIAISTRSKVAVNYQLVVTKAENFLLGLAEPRTIELSPASPVYYGFSFDKAAPHEKVKVIASAMDDDSYCTTISIQTFSCPIFDLEQTVNYMGNWKTITSSGVMTVEKTDFPHGFVIVLVAHSSHDLCLRRDPFSIPIPGLPVTINDEILFSNHTRPFQFQDDPFSKTITLNVTSSVELSAGEIMWSMFIPFTLTIFIAFLSGATLFYFGTNWLDCNELIESSSSSSSSSTVDDTEGIVNNEMLNINSDSLTEQNNLQTVGVHDEVDILSNVVHRASSGAQLPTSGDESNDLAPLFPTPPNISASRRVTGPIMLSHFGSQCKEQDRYLWLTGTVGWFYAVPVCQFAVFYYRVFINVGDYDVCYYNDRCSNSVGPFVDFNHIWSNSSYVIFGLVFILVVRVRRSKLTKLGVIDDENRQGVRNSFGLLNALGVSLIMEGVLSAIYHLCPNQATFQFDTCFMYVIAILIHLKLYKNRHPGSKPEVTYMTLALMLTLPVIELIFEALIAPGRTEIYFAILVVVQYSVMITLAIHYCLIGYIRHEDGKSIRGIGLLHPCHVINLSNWKEVEWRRYVIPVMLLINSVAVLVYQCKVHLPIPSYVLYVLVGNTMAIILCYFLLKVSNGEFKNYTWVLPSLYLLLGFGLGAWSGTYFLQTASQWELPPSESRKLNIDCTELLFIPQIPRFYDVHDLWHFLSAGALFFTFMGLLVLDNDLTYTPRKKINVF